MEQGQATRAISRQEASVLDQHQKGRSDGRLAIFGGQSKSTSSRQKEEKERGRPKWKNVGPTLVVLGKRPATFGELEEEEEK